MLLWNYLWKSWKISQIIGSVRISFRFWLSRNGRALGQRESLQNPSTANELKRNETSQVAFRVWMHCAEEEKKWKPLSLHACHKVRQHHHQTICLWSCHSRAALAICEGSGRDGSLAGKRNRPLRGDSRRSLEIGSLIISEQNATGFGFASAIVCASARREINENFVFIKIFKKIWKQNIQNK